MSRIVGMQPACSGSLTSSAAGLSPPLTCICQGMVVLSLLLVTCFAVGSPQPAWIFDITQSCDMSCNARLTTSSQVCEATAASRLAGVQSVRMDS